MFRWTVRMNRGDTGETPERHHSAVVIKYKLYVFMASRYDLDQVEVYIFNTVSLHWNKLSPVTSGRDHLHEIPTKRRTYTVVLIEDIIYIWGGVNAHIRPYQYYNELYALDVDTHRWSRPRVSGTVPEARTSHSACVLDKVMYIHGGWRPSECTKDIYKLDTTTMVWTLINSGGTLPPVSESHTSTIIGKKMFVFGGSNRDEIRIKRIRVFDTETNVWLSTPSSQLCPAGRRGHKAIAYNGELYIFGGDNVSRTLDMWKFHPETFSWYKVETKGKSPPQTCFMCCCMVGDRIVIVGGSTGRFKPCLNMFKETSDLYILELSPSLKTLCKLAVIHYGLEQSELTHDVRWELRTITEAQE